MFRENKGHLQKELFNSFSNMNSKIQEKLQKSWAPLYYEHVFCKIDETKFAQLYCLDNGRPNFPVNVLLSLEFIKHQKDYTDEEIIEQFYFNYQIMYALGLRNLGDLYLAPRTLYEFRERIYRYTFENPGKEDLIFGQFENLTAHFIKAANLDTQEQRMDSTQIIPNIKLAGRLSLAFDLLMQAVKVCPPEMLSDALKEVLHPNYKNDVLYRSKNSELKTRLQQLLKLICELLKIIESYPEIGGLSEIQLLQRFLEEQTLFDSKSGTWIPKENKEIAANSLQSAYDQEATYRNKGGKKHVGYVVNIAETCAKENPVQLITDYMVAPNTTSDIQMLKERLPGIQAKMAVTDIYVDGGYYGEDICQQTQTSGISMHFTNMTGRKVDSGKLSFTEFKIENHKTIISCPAGQAPFRTHFDEKSSVLSAHFDLATCEECPLKDACRVKFQKKSTVIRMSQKNILTAETRERIHSKSERQECTSKRAAIEGTNSALKRAHGADRLDVRGLAKSTLVMGMKIIGHNFRQMVRFFTDKVKSKTPVLPIKQGIPAPTC